MKVFRSLDEIRAAQGSVLGTSAWLTIDQDRIDRFARATGDQRRIHHESLALSLLPSFGAQNYRIEGARLSVNYGLNKVRFIAPVTVGSRLRGTTELVAVEDLDTGAQLLFRTTVELDGSERPACVAETLSRQYF